MEGIADMADIYDAGRFKLTPQDLLVLIFTAALALWSTSSNDVWVVGLMLCVAAITSVFFCIRHKGPGWIRFVSAIAIVLILVFVGWRDLRHTSLPAPVMNSAAPSPPPPASVNQHADNSDCSNVVAGGDVNMNCTPSEKAHGKNRH